eukprot:365602-Chlamydomonas_euryale.AAC.20
MVDTLVGPCQAGCVEVGTRAGLLQLHLDAREGLDGAVRPQHDAVAKARALHDPALLVVQRHVAAARHNVPVEPCLVPLFVDLSRKQRHEVAGVGHSMGAAAKPNGTAPSRSGLALAVGSQVAARLAGVRRACVCRLSWMQVRFMVPAAHEVVHTSTRSLVVSRASDARTSRSQTRLAYNDTLHLSCARRDLGRAKAAHVCMQRTCCRGRATQHCFIASSNADRVPHGRAPKSS